MDLKTLKPAPGSHHRIKRIGRGIGSGHGKTSGRGHKGRGSRSGGNTPPGYEGGQMPLQRRIPKHGFRRLQSNQADRDRIEIVNLAALAIFADGSEVNPATLAEKGLVKAGKKVKILAEGALGNKITVRAHAFSKAARDKISAAGGVAELIQESSSNA
ncbi:MAG: 50S ribosomal protein L15 [Candidatus Binataceae bacterium]|jgi:large subunit ribosomal protein L15